MQKNVTDPLLIGGQFRLKIGREGRKHIHDSRYFSYVLLKNGNILIEKY